MNQEEYFVYKFTFPCGREYIGLTCRPEKRFRDHILDKGSVYRFIKKNFQREHRNLLRRKNKDLIVFLSRIDTKYEIIHSKLTSDQGIKLEKELISKNFNSLINKCLGGSLGGKKWKNSL